MTNPPRTTVRALVHLYSPPYLISALAALASLHPGRRIAATFFVQLPGASPELLSEMVAVVRELATGHAFLAGVDGTTDDAFADASDVDLRDRLGSEFDDFLYSHDSTGEVCRRLAHAFPAARKVCIGDGYGMVYPAGFIADYNKPRSVIARAAAWAKAAVRRAGFRRPLPPLQPDIAALVLPVDPSGRGLDGVPLVCCTAEDFKEALLHCHRQAASLRNYMAQMLERYAGRKRYVLLTEPYVEAGYVRADREAAMYAAAIQAHCEHGSVVLVKSHPTEVPGTATRIRDALAAAFDVVPTEGRFQRYPIEIWMELIRGCTVISAAYPVLSLKYAHGIDVVQPMDKEFIVRWIEPAHQAWVRDGLRVYMEPLARLASWDGRCVLWSGEASP